MSDEPTGGDTNMEDTPERREQRKEVDTNAGPEEEEPKGKPFIAHNRAQRRRIAKSAKLFRDPSRDSWRQANKHMKNRGGQRGK